MHTVPSAPYAIASTMSKQARFFLAACAWPDCPRLADATSEDRKDGCTFGFNHT